MLEFCSRIKARLSCTFPAIFREDTAKEHDAYWINNLSKIIVSHRKYASFLGVPFRCSDGRLEYRQCDIPYRQPLIGIQGDVYTDFFIYQIRKYDSSKPIIWNEWFKDRSKEVPQHQYIMGNILEQSWKTIWNKGYAPFLKELRKHNNCSIPLSNFDNIYTKSDWSKDPKWSFCQYCGRRWGFSY